MTEPGLVAIYRWRVAAENRPAFRDTWERATLRLRALGGQGSLLGEDADGTLVAIALWPDAAIRDAAFAATEGEFDWPEAERLDPILVTPEINHWDFTGGEGGA